MALDRSVQPLGGRLHGRAQRVPRDRDHPALTDPDRTRKERPCDAQSRQSPCRQPCSPASFGASADVITDWNAKAGELVVEAKLGTPPANRVMAVVQTAVYDAVNAITRHYPAGRPGAAPGASIDAAVAAANRAMLTKLMPG